MTTTAEGGTERTLPRVAPVALAVAIAVVYLPSLSGGFLNLDDPWLVENNPLLAPDAEGALGKIWLAFDRETRMTLGAEYLPVRDTSLWLEGRLWGLAPQGLRITQLLLYVVTCLLLRSALRRVFGGGVTAEAAAWLFALHPVHVESVAWIASRKDVLAMLFVAAALFVHAGERRHRIVLVPLLVLLAGLSKAMALITPGLLLAFDLLSGERPDKRVYVPTLAVSAVVAWVAVSVGDTVGMTTAPLGGDRVSAAAGLGRAFLHYFRITVDSSALSIVHDPPAHTWGLAPVVGWLAVAGWGAAGWVLRRSSPERTGRPLVLAAWLAFVVPLLPVSQIVFPLQNFWADRYLFLSVLGPALLVGGFLEQMGDRRALGGAFVLAGGMSLFTFKRADLFADSIRVMRNATDKTEIEALAPYQLAQAYEADGKDDLALKAYREVLVRARGRQEEARYSTNNLAKLLARKGALTKAEAVLQRGRTLWPDDPKILGNLAEVVARQPGREEEARTLYDQVLREHPGYAPARERYEARYGNAP